MLDVGGASSLLVVTEFILGLLITCIATFAAKYRAQRILYTTSFLDLSEIAWTSRRFLNPRLVVSGPYILFLNVVGVLGPCVIIILFAFIGHSLRERPDVRNYQAVQTKVHAQDSYWASLGAKTSLVRGIDRALSKGEWKGLPGDGFVPVNNEEFSRLKWVGLRAQYKCEQVIDERAEYSITAVRKRVDLDVEYTTDKTNLLVTEESRIRKVSDPESSREWFSTPFRSSSLFVAIPNATDSKDQAELKYSSINTRTSEWNEHASGAAYRLKFSNSSIPAADYSSTELLNFPNITNALDYTPYVTLLNNIAAKKLSSHERELCASYTAADVVVDFVGIPKGRRGLFDISGHDRVDVTRGNGVRQRFVCKRKKKIRKNSCDMLPISTSTLAAGLAAKLKTGGVFGNSNPSTDEDLYSVSKLTQKLSPEDVAEAMEVGIHVLIAGAAVKEETQTVHLAKKSAFLNWTLYAITTGGVVALCLLIISVEFLARIRHGRVKMNVAVPLDPYQMAHACGMGETERATYRRRETPASSTGIGVRLRKSSDRSMGCWVDIGSFNDRDGSSSAEISVPA